MQAIPSVAKATHPRQFAPLPLLALLAACAAAPASAHQVRSAPAQASTQGSGSANVLAPSAQARAVMLGPDFVREFMAGRTEELWNRSSADLQKLFKSAEGVAAFANTVRTTYGAERSLVRERVDKLPKMDVYTREVVFEKNATQLQFIVGIDAKGTVVAFGLKPVPVAAVTTKLDYVHQVRLRLPMDGTWAVVWAAKPSRRTTTR
jgi:hypothetical protein